MSETNGVEKRARTAGLRVLEGAAAHAELEDLGPVLAGVLASPKREAFAAALGVEPMARALALRAADPVAFARYRAGLRGLGVPTREYDRALEAFARAALPSPRPTDPVPADGAGDAPAEDPSAGPYVEREGGLYFRRGVRDGGTVLERLANFRARIAATVLEHVPSGPPRRWYELEVRMGARAPRRIEVRAEDFAGLRWVECELGHPASIGSGPSTRDRVREAVQLLSGDEVPERHRYALTGWVQLDGGAWRYLDARGAIGPEGRDAGVEVGALPAIARAYALPAEVPEGEDLRRAVGASLELFRQDPARVFVPLVAVAWRAVLGPSPVTLYVLGPQHAGKTLLATLAQQHFGAEARVQLTWDSATSNALAHAQATVGDAVLVVDDNADDGTHQGERIAESVSAATRRQHEGVGKARLSRDGALREAPGPRCLLVSTGEVLPRGRVSLLQRMLLLAVDERVPVDLGPFRARADAGELAGATAAYVRWLAPRLDAVRAELPALCARIAARYRGPRVNDRTAHLVAHLGAAVRHFLAFAREAGALDAAAHGELRARADAALRELAADQAGYHEAQDPARRFVEVLGSALRTGRCHLAGPDGVSMPEEPGAWGWRPEPERTGALAQAVEPPWRARGEHVGYLRRDKAGALRVYLDPTAALRVARTLCEAGRQPLAVSSQKELSERLAAAGLLARTERHNARRTCTVRVTLGRRQLDALCLDPDTLAGGPAAASDPGDVEAASEGSDI